jgi:hypothetical protein
VIKTRIFDVAAVGVIVAVRVVSVKVDELMVVEVVVVALTTCNTFPPAAGAAHFNPVAVALSATKPAILQEQSQRIVLSTQLRLASSQVQKPSVGLGAGGFQKEPDLIQDGYGCGVTNISSSGL